jgi:cystathionine gamma-synthase
MTQPVDRSTIWPYDEHGEVGDFYYARNAHPTGVAAERELGRLEGGDALLFASGMAATATVLLALAQPGARIALAHGAYYGTGKLMGMLGRWGLEHVEFDQTGEPPDDAAIVWIEQPANPTLTEPSWEALRAHPGLVVCDATLATPVYLRALDEGADVVVHSATKFLTGHHDALLGATVSRGDVTSALREWRTNVGSVAAPDPAAALLRGLETLETRMRRHTETATELARRLAEHPAVGRVRYPGYGGVISFDVADPRAVETATETIVNATSLGGVRSSMESRHRWEGNRIPAGLLRLSVGLEPVEELWADLARALGRPAHRSSL